MANTGVKYTIKSISDEGEFYLVKDWRKNKELWVNKSRMDMHPQWWFTSSGKALQSLKSLLKVMDDYLADDLYVIDDQGNETPVDVKALGFDHIPEYWDDDIDACDNINGATEPNSPDVDKTKLVRQVIKQAKEIRDYFQSHNNNLNRKQEQYLEDLSDGIDNQSVYAIREAIENMKYNSKNLRSEQYNLIMDLYDEFNLAGGKFEGMGYPDDDIDACDKIVGGTNPDFAEEKVKFFYNSKFIGSCNPEYIECESLRDAMYSDTELSSLILEYLNSLGDPVFPVSEEDWGTPETDVSKIDIDDLYSTFMQELQFEYNDFPEDFFVELSVPRSGKHTLEIFTGAVAEGAVMNSTKISAASSMESNARKLLNDIHKKLANWNERSGFTLKGVKNLSRSDLDTLEFFAETILDTGSLAGYNAYGGVADVLTAYNLKSNSGDVWGTTKPKYFANMVSASDTTEDDESEWYDWWNDVDGYLMGWDKEFKQLIYDFRKKNGWPKNLHDPLCDKLADVVYEYVRTHLDKLAIDPNENDDRDYREFAGERMIDWLLEEPAAYDFWADYKG